MNNIDFIQSPTAKLIDVGNGKSLLILEDWNVLSEQEGYTRDEVESLIKMLQESLDIMDRYHRANENLPLFEEGDLHVQQQTPSTL